jgi:hypothetical protein
LSNPFVNITSVRTSSWVAVVTAHENFIQALDPAITKMLLYVPNGQMMFLIFAKY